MNEKIINCYNNFQIADFDNDMIGICKSFVDWIKVIRQELGEEDLPQENPPSNYHKLPPHIPRSEIRNNYREALPYAVKYQNEDDNIIKLKNIYIVVLAGMYIYHTPVDSILKASLLDNFTRKDAENILLEDGMSPNWIKDPSKTDYSKIML